MAEIKNSRWLTPIIVLLPIVAVIVHASRYLPESPSLFTVVVVSRTVFAVGVAAMFLFVFWLAGALFRTTFLAGRTLKLAGVVFAVVVVLMLLISLDNPFPDGVLNLYLLERQ